MDFDKIKRSLRFRSGRSKKKPEKQTSETETAPTQNGGSATNGAERQLPARPPTQEHSFSPKKDNPSFRLWDQTTALPAVHLDYSTPEEESPPNGPLNSNATAPNPANANGAVASPRPPPKPSNTYSYQRQNSGIESQAQKGAENMASAGRRAAPRTQSSLQAPNAPQRTNSATQSEEDFDLRPPPRSKKPTSVDTLTEELFSGGHLNTILQDNQLFGRFTAFLNRYRPQAAPTLIRYLETQKAVKAIEYANAVAESVAPLPDDGSKKELLTAAKIDGTFEAMRKRAFDELLSEALPGYITYNIIRVVTEVMVNEITGRQTPIMKGLLSGLTEVFCLTDPNQEDNPIIYASEEFYKMTGYGRDFVIGTNCRFLQGPKTKRHSVHRLRQAIDSGQEVSETLLNYKRDGRPFVNLLMVAPLLDNKGNIKYNIGAQVDASGLIQGGKGLDGFEKYLSQRQAEESRQPRRTSRHPKSQESLSGKEAKKRALTKLGELSEMFDLEETAVVSQRSRSNSRRSEESMGSNKERRIFTESSESEGEGEKEKEAWRLSSAGSSGKLPGVYQSYLLMRPDSLKIIFTSPGLRKMGDLVQTRFMSHITGPSATLTGLKESFQSGTPVTAKVLFSSNTEAGKSGRVLERGQHRNDIDDASSAKLGRTCWISATPLLGSDDGVGVWMVVIVEKRSLTSAMSPVHSNSLSESQRPASRMDEQVSPSKPSRPTHIDMPDDRPLSSESSVREAQIARKGSGMMTNAQSQPRMVLDRTESGREIMVRKHEPLYRQQQREKAEQNRIEEKKKAEESQASNGTKNVTDDADEFVRKFGPRSMGDAGNGRVTIRPDSDDLESEVNRGRAGRDLEEDRPASKDDDYTLPTQMDSLDGAADVDKAQDELVAPGEEAPWQKDTSGEDISSRYHEEEAKDVPTQEAEPNNEQEGPAGTEDQESSTPRVPSRGEESHEDAPMSPSHQTAVDPEADLPQDEDKYEKRFEPTSTKTSTSTYGGHGSVHPDKPDSPEPAEPSSESAEPEPEAEEADSKTALPAMYMDYLRHPGSRPASQQHGKPGMNLSSGGATMSQLREASGALSPPGGGGSGSDCARTPFSID